MYEVVYDSEVELFYIVNDGVVLYELGGFIELVTPEIIIKEIENG